MDVTVRGGALVVFLCLLLVVILTFGIDSAPVAAACLAPAAMLALELARGAPHLHRRRVPSSSLSRGPPLR